MAKRPPPPKKQPVKLKPPPQIVNPPVRPNVPTVAADPFANQMQSLAQIMRDRPQPQPYNPPTQSLPYYPQPRPQPYNPSAAGPAPMQPMGEPQMSTGLTLSPQQQNPEMSPGLTYDPNQRGTAQPFNPPMQPQGGNAPMQQPIGMEGFQQRYGTTPQTIPFSNQYGGQSANPWRMQQPYGNRPMQPYGGGGMGGFGGTQTRPSTPFGADPYKNRMQPYGGAQMSPGLTYQKPQMSPGMTYSPYGGATRNNKGSIFSSFSKQRGGFGG